MSTSGLCIGPIPKTRRNTLKYRRDCHPCSFLLLWIDFRCSLHIFTLVWFTWLFICFLFSVCWLVCGVVCSDNYRSARLCVPPRRGACLATICTPVVCSPYTFIIFNSFSLLIFMLIVSTGCDDAALIDFRRRMRFLCIILQAPHHDQALGIFKLIFCILFD